MTALDKFHNSAVEKEIWGTAFFYPLGSCYPSVTPFEPSWAVRGPLEQFRETLQRSSSLRPCPSACLSDFMMVLAGDLRPSLFNLHALYEADDSVALPMGSIARVWLRRRGCGSARRPVVVRGWLIVRAIIFRPLRPRGPSRSVRPPELLLVFCSLATLSLPYPTRRLLRKASPARRTSSSTVLVRRTSCSTLPLKLD